MSMVISAIQQGGVWMVPIIVAMVFAFSIAFERIYYVGFRANMNGKALMQEIRRSIMANKIDDAINFCEERAKEGKALPVVLRAGLKAANRTEVEIESAMEQSTLDVFPRLNKRTPYLSMLANVATLSGLL